MRVKLGEIEAYLHQTFPFARSCGLRLAEYNGEFLRLQAPLQQNSNHHNTAFGGSLASFGILAGWTLLHMKLREHDIDSQLVIQKSRMDFLAPVSRDFETLALIPTDDAWRRFLNTLNRRGKARIHVCSQIIVGDRVAGVHEGAYVALRNGQ
ncbi:MAG: YiiD C-terminal domain-containing protein [candidate division KSB1 bacterium]|nr:YiiD C-terminal domain-containing protein [candidate division KSB1 bacterium]MDQ7064289.1 YiiD C-terminal domain-containing protein [candidate division KSB1 bacterium]